MAVSAAPTTSGDRGSRAPLPLPDAPAPIGNYVRGAVHGGIAMLSGQLPLRDGEVLLPGRLGANLSIEQGKAAARQAALNALAQLHRLTDGFASLEGLLRLEVLVACTPDFFDHAAVADGASDLLVEALGERGRHARSAAGVVSLPRGAAVELVLSYGADWRRE